MRVAIRKYFSAKNSTKVYPHSHSFSSSTSRSTLAGRRGAAHRPYPRHERFSHLTLYRGSPHSRNISRTYRNLLDCVMGHESCVTRIKRLPLPPWRDRNETNIETICRLFVYLIIGLFIYWIITPQTVEYARHNDRLILQANDNYAKISEDTEQLLKTLKALPPSRIYAGRGGNWGKQFRVAETPMFMHISTYGIPTVLWLPETWSPNSDTEQFFNEENPDHYVLYNLRYVLTPPDKEPLSFWKPLKKAKHGNCTKYQVLRITHHSQHRTI